MTSPKPDQRISLSELALHGLSDTPSHRADTSNTPRPEDPISKLVRLAARVLHVPLAVVALTREYYARCVPSPAIEPARFDRAVSIGAHVVTGGVPLIVNDTHADARFESHREVRDLGIRAFAGVPISLSTGGGGVVIGAFKVRDTRARTFTPADVETLTLLAGFVARELELRDLAEMLDHREAEGRAARPLSGRSVLVIGKPGASRRLVQDRLSDAGALVDGAEPGGPTDECLHDATLLGVEYSVIVLDEGAGSSVSELRAQGCTVPIVAICPGGVDPGSLLAAGCDQVAKSALDHPEVLVEACVRVTR